MTGLIILAGGKSSRMGTNKALLPIGGKTNIEHIIDTLAPSFSNVVLVTNEQETYRSLGVPMVSDVYSGQGPLAGIHAGLLATECTVNLVVACDMPFVSEELAAYMVGCCEALDAVVPRWNSQLHPLYAVYRKTCIPVIEECIHSGNLRMVHFLEKLHVKYLDETDLRSVISSDQAFTNMNTPEEYQKVLNTLQNKEDGN